MKDARLAIDVRNEYFSGRIPAIHPVGSTDNVQ